MSETLKTLIILTSSILLFTGCGNSDKQTKTAADVINHSSASATSSAPKLTGLAKWQVTVPSQFSGARWASFADKYPAADLEIAPDEEFNTRLKTLLDGQSYNLNEYICTGSEYKSIGKLNYQLITCVIPTYAEYSYFINLLDTKTKINRIYKVKDISVNNYLGKERDSDPERIYEYQISNIETKVPFMDSNAILLELDRKYTVSTSIEEGADVKTDYHTYENYIFAGDDMRLVMHWSAKHTQSISDWMACDRSNPDPKLCPHVQSQQACNQAVFDGRTWSIAKGSCL